MDHACCNPVETVVYGTKSDRVHPDAPIRNEGDERLNFEYCTICCERPDCCVERPEHSSLYGTSLLLEEALDRVALSSTPRYHVLHDP